MKFDRVVNAFSIKIFNKNKEQREIRPKSKRQKIIYFSRYWHFSMTDVFLLKDISQILLLTDKRSCNCRHAQEQELCLLGNNDFPNNSYFLRKPAFFPFIQ